MDTERNAPAEVAGAGLGGVAPRVRSKGVGKGGKWYTRLAQYAREMHGGKHREIQREGAGLKTREPNEEYKCRIISGERDEVKAGMACRAIRRRKSRIIRREQEER